MGRQGDLPWMPKRKMKVAGLILQIFLYNCHGQAVFWPRSATKKHERILDKSTLSYKTPMALTTATTKSESPLILVHC